MDKIYKIFLNRAGIDFKRHPELVNQKLFGKSINIPPRELLQIYMDLKKELNVKFDENEIIHKRFDTFDNIVKLIEETCEHSVG